MFGLNYQYSLLVVKFVVKNTNQTYFHNAVF